MRQGFVIALFAAFPSLAWPQGAPGAALSPGEQRELASLRTELGRSYDDRLLGRMFPLIEDPRILEQVRSTARSPREVFGLSVPILGSRPDAEKAKDRLFLHVLAMGAAPQRVLKQADSRFSYEFLGQVARAAEADPADMRLLRQALDRDLVLARYEQRPRRRGFSPYGMDPDTPANEGGNDLAPGVVPGTPPAGDDYDANRQRFGRLIWRSGFTEVVLLGRPVAHDPAVHCTGTLIHARWILTAAHCFFDDAGQAISSQEMAAYLRFQGGTASVRGRQKNAVNTGMRAIAIESVQLFDRSFRPSEKYVREGADIALVKLATAPPRPVYHAVVPLEKAATPVTIGGYGLTNAVDVGLAGSTLEISRKESLRVESRTIILDPRSAASMGGFCKGDSGGPVFLGEPDGTEQLKNIRHEVVGVVSAAFTALSGIYGCYGVEMHVSRVDRADVRKWLCEASSNAVCATKPKPIGGS